MSHELTELEKAALLSGASVWETRAVPRAGIRPLNLSDGPHGIRKQLGSGDHLGINGSAPATCFPTAATVANAWDAELTTALGEALGAEAAALDVDMVLGPGLNIKRSPLCGRNFEYFSEDPYLSGKLAAAYVRGIQSQGVSACPKHFAANSQEHRRMASDSVVDERTLREIYLTAFEIVVRESSPKAIMSAYNKVNGTYAHENAHLLQEILRDGWGFDGAVVSDWGGSNDAVTAVENGGTLEMPSPGLDSARQIVTALRAGRLAEADLDARVDEMVALVERIDPSLARAVDEQAHHELARRVAESSHVLLRNAGGLLPLAAGARVAVIGDFAQTPRYQGAGSSLVNPTRLSTVLDALPGSGLELVRFAQGFRRTGGPDAGLLAEAVEAARSADVALVFLGLDETSESEGNDRTHMRLPANQIGLLDALHREDVPVVVVLSAGSAIEMPWLEQTDALVHGYLGGQAGAEATLNVLTGRVNPSGRLAETYPVRLEDNPSHAYYPGLGDASEYREGLYVGYRYYETVGADVLFPFGFGLSYTTFEISDLVVTASGATVTVTNTGTVAGGHVAQLYVERVTDGAHRPVRELKGFAKVELAPGASTTVEIPFDRYTFRTFDPAADAWVTEAGEYRVAVGSHVRDLPVAAVLHVDGASAAADPAPAVYRTGDVVAVTDADFEALLGRALPTASAERELLDANSPLLAMHHAPSPLARGAAGALKGLIARSQRKGKPDLNLFFLYNMPFRAMGKMTNGAVSMDMVDGIVDIANGHLLRGVGATASGFVRNARESKRLTAELADHPTPAASAPAQAAR
ncbi:glycoside hydrolase family 3 C-terminal domain-containing protein [Demequina lignilytica]|uniref:Glycoside hydrolase family 3 C-terminal domain-containing protein n=1 Tax=Demequina lignilytica TaxID=3051663 RepID=A0AB35MGU1_9MICO|nr:glycoside hydrolase family 3 C-terminal domain-containing protein [Demequina sp. SYSU T0a273]MDN4483014.1 glycoside hydrolase family 3 C-terminal domain-containing protein [Demequina sp. SYSU T0a273]